MSRDAVLLHPRRLRAVVVVAVVAIMAALWVLAPAPRRGLVLYATSDGATLLADAFSRETGIPVTVVRLSTGTMLARISAESGRPRWSLAWVDGDMAAAALDRAGLLDHGAVPAVAWTELGRALIPADGAWVPTGVTLAGVMLHRAGATGPTGIPDPTLSGPAYPEIAGLLQQAGGWPQGRAMLIAWHEAGLSVAPTSLAVVEELRAGRIGRALIQSSTAYALVRHDPMLAVHVPAPAFLLPGVVMVSKGIAPAMRRDADRFIAFVLSRRGQQLRTAAGTIDSYYWPVTQGVPTPRPMPPIATLTTVHLDPYRWAAIEASVTNWFETRMARS